MKGKKPNCWATVVYDKATALEALILAKSMARVLTEADLIVFTPLDIPDDIEKALKPFFDTMVAVNIRMDDIMGFPLKHYLMLSSWNLAMYGKCILLSPRTMVIRNCDELFHILEETTFTSFFGSNTDSMVNVDTVDAYLITPCIQKYKQFLKAVLSRQFSSLSSLTQELFPNPEDNRIPISHIFYYYNRIHRFSNLSVDDIKIVVYDKIIPGKDMDLLDLEYGIQCIWTSLLDEIKCQLGPNSKLNSKCINFSNSQAFTFEKNKNYYKDAIAIIGHSCRFPGANNSDEFWTLLETGGDGIIPFPLDRLTDAQRNDPKYTESRAGFLKCPIDEFDAKFFGISPREAAFMDPQQRLLAEVAWEALENAGINPHSLKSSDTGVFSGVWTHDYEHLINENTTAQDFHHVVLGNAFSATAARVSYFLGLNGPNLAIESGCSSSMVALHLACESLKRKETKLGLIMGANIMINQFPLTEIPILAPDGHCKTFDETADGFGRAEGVAIIVVKRLTDAISNGDRVMGIIRGSAISNEGTSVNFGTPSKYCQEIAIKEALRKAGVAPEEVDYVEAHGTGTPVGDPIEFAALSSGYAGDRKKPLIIGSVKTNTGHTESASGLAGVIKVLLSMKHGIIPSHRNFSVLNPNIDISILPAVIPLEKMQWPISADRVRIAGVSSFGISGTNVHAILEEPPDHIFLESGKFKLHLSEMTYNILTLSAKSKNALGDLAGKYIEFLNSNHNAELSNVTYTANCGRAHLKYRNAIVFQNVENCISNLNDARQSCKTVGETLKVAFLFTGQGSQYIGMAKGLHDSNIYFRNAFNDCSNIIRQKIGICLADLWSGKCPANLQQTTHSQLSIFAVEYSLLKLWDSLGIKPDFVLGHSVGEFAAAVAAKMLSMEDAVELLCARSRLIQTLPPGGMMAVYCSKQKLSEIMVQFLNSNSIGWLDIAAVNSPEEIVVAGTRETTSLFYEFCIQTGIRCKLLDVSHAFHSRVLDGILEEFGEFAQCITYRAPSCSYISCLKGSILEQNEMDGYYWRNHARETVNFTSGMKTLSETDCTVYIEIGAHPILLALAMANVPNNENIIWLPSVRKTEDNWKTFLNSLGLLYSKGFDINWEALDAGFTRKKVELPTYPFQRQKYWMETTKELLGKPLHPLLGRKIALASLKDSVYENTCNLKDLKYLEDHQVVNTVVLPGAGFLEIILAACHDVFLTRKSNFRVIIEDFVIESPLELDVNKNLKFQVVVCPVDVNLENAENTHSVKIYVYRSLNGYNDEKGWKQYSSANVALQNIVPSETPIDIPKDLENIKSRCPLEIVSEDFYKLAPEIGIHFGKTFQSIETVWQGENEVLAKILLLPSKAGNMSDYIYHPIVLDAMIQSFGFSIGKEKKHLYLPVGIDRFTMISLPNKEKSSNYFYAHACWENGKTTGLVSLYSGTNTLLGKMEGIRLLQTSTSSFLNVINAQKNLLPGLYQEVWRVRDGPYQSRVNLHLIPDPISTKYDLELAMKNYSGVPNEEIEILGNELYSLTLIAGFIRIGWNPNIGEIFTTESIIKNLLFFPCYSNLVNRILEIICEDNYSVEIPLKNSECNKQWKLIKKFPSIEKLPNKQNYLLNLIHAKSPNGEHVITKIAFRCAENLLTTMQTNGSSVSALFDIDDLNPLDVYTKGIEVILANMRIGKYMQLALKEFQTTEKQDASIVRILEIGSGSGATSKQVIQHLQESGIQFRYTFTDLSPRFLEKAREQFSRISNIEYKILDIEKDPAAQGFCPNYYDIVIAANVIHATQSLRKSIQNVSSLLAPQGILVLLEMLRPLRNNDMIFGVLEDFWKFTDYDLRKAHPIVSKTVWDKVFLENGFSNSEMVSNTDEIVSVLVTRKVNVEIIIDDSITPSNAELPVWLIFCDEGSIHKNLGKYLVKRNVKVINIRAKSVGKDESSNEDLILGLKTKESEINEVLMKLDKKYKITGIVYLTCLNEEGKNIQDIYEYTLYVCKYFAANVKSLIQMYAISRGAQFTSNQANVFPNTAPILGMMKCLINEIPLINVKIIDLDPDIIDEEIESKEIFYHFFTKDERCVSFRNRRKLLNRMIKMPKPMAPLPLPKGRYKIEIPATKNISDITFRNTREENLKNGEIEVLVKATALNFRDVFVIMKPEGYHTSFNAVGTDFSGIVSKIGPQVTKYKIGDSVFGISNESSAASHVKVHFGMVMLKPKYFTFGEASTFPSVFFTAWHCLVEVADLKKEEIILIHVASGGVGLVAIQIAKHIGAKIIATAGCHRKRSYLKSIGIENVFHSRDLSFGDEIQKVTHGKGVDMVLNSLTGHGFIDTSLGICAENARFVEMGKVNIWSVEEVQSVRPDVKYKIVDVEKLNINNLQQLMNVMEECVHKGIISPLPYSRFEISHLRDALNYFLKAQHIGKIVVGIPEVRGVGSGEFHADCIFNSNATYLITGGLGGIGLEVTKWMVDCGAENIVLVGRSPPSEKAHGVLNSLKGRGCRIITLQVDVGNMDQCRKLFGAISDQHSDLPPLKGVIHSAGALSDAIFVNQSWEKYETVFNAKVRGGWNLHELTKNMRLEHFVLFSSVASQCAPPGQSNHSGANMFLDALAHYRYSVGLPAQTVNFGAWSEIGAATNTVYGNEGALGIKPFTPSQGIAALRFTMMSPNLTQIGIVQIEMADFMKYCAPLYPVILELFAESVNDTSPSENDKNENFMTNISKLSLEERIVYIKGLLEKIVRKTLKLPDTEPIDEHQKFSELGLDSLMAIEMKNKLQVIVGKSVTLSATSLLDYPNIHGLSKFLAEETMSIILETEHVDNSEVNLKDLYELVKKDSILPEDINSVHINNYMEKPVKDILLTGTTGQMGPYILRELLQNDSIIIHCLIRGKNEQHARKKLNAVFKKAAMNMKTLKNFKNIRVVVGNICDIDLGLSSEEYTLLCEKIDYVFHFAAKINHVEAYQVTKSNVDTRSVNVLGTKNILRFASQMKTKHVLFASTYTAINRFTPEGHVLEEFPENTNFGDGITNGYILSKFVGEKLMCEASRRGIPCTVIRYPTIIGDSQTGHFTVEKNLLMNFILLSFRLGIFPDIKSGWNSLPVDVAAKLTKELIFNENSKTGVYNIFHTNAMTSSDIAQGAVNSGIDIRIVNEDEYFTKFEQESKDDPIMSVYLEAFGDLKKGVFSTGIIDQNSAGVEEGDIFRYSENLLNVIPDIKDKIANMRTVIHSHIDFAKRSGLLEKIGVKANF